MTFYVQKNSFMYRLFLEIPQGAEKMEFRFIYVNIFCWTKYDRFRFERNVNTQGSKSNINKQ